MNDNDYLIIHLPFNSSTIYDICGNSWLNYGTSIGNPNAEIIENDNILKESQNALSLNGNNYIKLKNIILGGKDFVIDFYLCLKLTESNKIYLSDSTGTYRYFTYSIFEFYLNNQTLMYLYGNIASRWNTGSLAMEVRGGSQNTSVRFGSTPFLFNAKDNDIWVKCTFCYCHNIPRKIKVYKNNLYVGDFQYKDTFYLFNARRTYSQFTLGYSNIETNKNAQNILYFIKDFKIYDGIHKLSNLIDYNTYTNQLYENSSILNISFDITDKYILKNDTNRINTNNEYNFNYLAYIYQ